MLYGLFIPKQAVGANLIYFDLWNEGSVGQSVSVVSVRPVVSGAVAVTGVLGVDLHLSRTTAIGTGGTAATTEGTSLTAATFTQIDGDEPLYGVSARLTPSGGATAGATIGWTCVFTEETADATYNMPANMLVAPLLLRAGSGIGVVQGAVASVGNIGFNVVLGVEKR